MMEILGKTKIDFMGKRNIAFGVSAILAILGVICVIRIATGGANMGIDFAGGASASLVFQRPVPMDAARSALDKAGFRDAELQSFTDGSKMLVRIKKTDVPVG